MPSDLGGSGETGEQRATEQEAREAWSKAYREWWSNPENVAQWDREYADYLPPERPSTAEQKRDVALSEAREAVDGRVPFDVDDWADPRRDLEQRERYDPDAYRAMLEQRDRMVGEDRRLEGKTFGLLADETGGPLWDDVQYSGERASTQRLWASLGLSDRDTAQDHLEAHTAADMRERGITEGYLYIDRPVCPYDRERKEGWEQWPTCDRSLPVVLAPGSKLTVYHEQPGEKSSGHGPRLWSKTYIGEQEEADG